MKKTLLLLEFLLAIIFSNAQNVGIGTTTPLSKLHVSFGASGNVAPFSPLVVEGNNNTYINLLAPNINESGLLFGKAENAASGAIIYNNINNLNGFQFRTNGNLTKVVINNSGSIGIGVNTPNAKLSISSSGTELAGAAASNMFRIHAGTLGSVAGNEIILASIGFASGNHSSLGIRAYRTEAGSNWMTSALLIEHNVDNSERINGGYIALAANGNIGIGIAKPLAKLHVSAGDGSLALFGPNGYGGQLYVGAATNQGVASTAQVLASDGNLHLDPAAGKNIYLGYYQARDIYLNPVGGKVGIGNSNPAYQLDVSSRMRIRSGGNNTNSSGLWLNSYANTESVFIGMENDSHVGFYGVGTGWKFGMNVQTGALKINGSEGEAGQALVSGGAASPSWGYANSHYVGETYGGGIVFYVYDNGRHGLISSTVDQNPGIQWYNGINRYTGTTGDGIGAGSMNTALIVATQMGDFQTGNFAAKLCADYSVTVDGVAYGDWYLPSRVELTFLYLQRNVVGGFSAGHYWSSTEDIPGNSFAKMFNFNLAISGDDHKDVTNKVRAIRAF